MLKRLLSTVTVVIMALGGVVVASAPAQADHSGFCGTTISYPMSLNTPLRWSAAGGYWYTELLVSGTCRHVYIRHLGVYNAPGTARYFAKTYDGPSCANGRVTGDWVTFHEPGQFKDLLRGIMPLRCFRVAAQALSINFRTSLNPLSFVVYAGGAPRS